LKYTWILILLILFSSFSTSCGKAHPLLKDNITPIPDPTVPFVLIPFESDVQEIRFQSSDGTWLAGQFDWPKDVELAPLVFVIHHSGAVDRNSYQYLAAFLVPAGYGVFRFDKRGTGLSEGEYGCCEDEDALAAYRAAIDQSDHEFSRVIIIAQSVGTQILAQNYHDFEKVRSPDGVILLSNLLKGEEILPIKTRIHIVISDQEADFNKVGIDAADAHRRAYQSEASIFVAMGTEHTLFDVTQGPIDWSDPQWPNKFSKEAKQSILDWLENIDE
jgi:alpha/beta superfamily hydrolase